MTPLEIKLESIALAKALVTVHLTYYPDTSKIDQESSDLVWGWTQDPDVLANALIALAAGVAAQYDTVEEWQEQCIGAA